MAEPTLREFSPIGCIKAERIKQDVKWGEQNHSDLKWLSILMEEVGEAAKTVNEDIPAKERLYSHDACIDNLEYELIQVAAVCIAWVESIRRRDEILQEREGKK